MAPMTDPRIIPALAPCPFCGSTDDDLSCDVDEYGRAYVVCGNCGTEGPFVVSHIIGSDAAIEQAATAWNQRNTWQPIETAPRDGTEILVLDGKRVSAVISNGPDAACFSNEFGDEESLVWFPTHWQPLPSPPITPNPNA
jgi:Lar family restriction alleviation protein